MDRQPFDSLRKLSKEPAASALTATPRVTGPGAERFGIREQLTSLPLAATTPAEPEDWGNGLIDLIAKPGWEYERAKALLRTGSTMPQILRHLMHKGLSLEAASKAAELAFENRVREQAAVGSCADQATQRHRSVSFAATCALAGFITLIAGVEIAVRCVFVLSPFLAWIWLGQYADWKGSHTDLHPPSGMIRWAGWLFFVLFVIPMVGTLLSMALH